MHLSEHIAIKGVESLSNGAGEGVWVFTPFPPLPTWSKTKLPLPGPATHLFKMHLQSSYCEQGVLGRWMSGKHIPMLFLWKTSPVIKNHSKNT